MSPTRRPCIAAAFGLRAAAILMILLRTAQERTMSDLSLADGYPDGYYDASVSFDVVRSGTPATGGTVYQRTYTSGSGPSCADRFRAPVS
jgi:hypothetical protein